jgi:hypothetical protein
MYRCSFSRKCACRREPNSHNAAKPRAAPVPGVLRRSAPGQQPQRTQNSATPLVQHQLPQLVSAVVGNASRQTKFCRQALLSVSSSARRCPGGFGFARLCPWRRENCQRPGSLSSVSLRRQSRGRLRVPQKVVPRCSVLPNPSVEPTRYGRQRKAGPRPRRHFRSPALRCLPPRASHLER